MSGWSELRRQARDWHYVIASDVDDLPPAATLLAKAEELTGVRRLGRPQDDALLDGAEACYDREGKRIFFSLALSADDAAFYVAHEYAHHKLHDLHSRCTAADVDTSTPAEPDVSVVGDSDAYSPKERAEAQANLFAREFLLPRDKLKQRCRDRPCDAEALASELGVPLGLVLQQMADALLLPDEPAARTARPIPPPDPSQKQAAEAPDEPHQVRAGPGTGKTRTLVARVKCLLDRGEDPASIVALTYSNASAADLALRLRAEIGDPAPAVWTGTFHAYGLELLRKYGEAIGLPLNPRLLDRSGSLFLLEELLPSLDLEHYLDLREPLLPLKAVTGAISRAKDQLVGPAEYARLAQAMLAVPDRAEAGAKAVEAARIYAAYQDTLQARGWVDFGDLIMRAHELLETDLDAVTAVRASVRHILVDEYQDMNRASALLLEKLVTPGKGPWVVGDVRQSIYRFRGASPLNMTGFVKDFPGANHTDLAVNYRSGGRIVRTFEAFGAKMSCAALAPDIALTPHRGEQAGTVHFSLAATFEAEAEGIARVIRQAQASSATFSDHVVLARSHTTLARIGAHLERAGIPSLYFGDFFEREEIRDLLCLLSVASEREGIGLLRVAQLDPYRVPVVDILAVFAWRKAQDVPMLTALRQLDAIGDISAAGRTGLDRLAADLAGVGWTTSPHALILRHLFCRDWVRHGKLGRETVAGQQARLAVYQLLQVAFNFRAAPEKDSKSAFLAHVRRLEILDEEKEFRQMPAAAAGIDAVRLMTVHASKGLEFPQVHLAALSPYYFPAPNRYDACPPPDGLVPADPLMGKDAEEDGLFFVALSRAEDGLSLSRALRYGGRSSPNPSRFLTSIAGHLPRSVLGDPDWVDEGRQPPGFGALALAVPTAEELSIRAIETYLECPRRYYYAHGLGLAERTSTSPYLGLISSVRATLSWASGTADQAVRAEGWPVEFDAHWQKIGPVDHVWASVYRASAEAMMGHALRITAGVSHDVRRRMTVAGQVVTARADSIVESDGAIVIQRLKAARLAKSETAKARYGALQAMVGADHPGVTVRFEHVSLVTGERRGAASKGDATAKSRAEIEDVLAGIAAGRFHPVTSDRRCPDCPYYFPCAAEGIPRTE
jgi:superfamily I DNA/RNA helicase